MEGRREVASLESAGFEAVQAHGETILVSGGSLTARYLELTMQELKDPLLGSGAVSPATWSETMQLLRNPSFWTWQNSQVTTSAQRAAVGSWAAADAPQGDGPAGPSRRWHRRDEGFQVSPRNVRSSPAVGRCARTPRLW